MTVTPIGSAKYQLDKAFEGQVANIQDYRHIAGTQELFINGGTTYLPFGRVVVRNGADAGATLILPSAAGQAPVGISIYNDRFMASTDSPRVTGFPPKQTMAVLKKGVIYMVTETGLTKGATSLFFRHTLNTVPGVNEAVGRLLGAADAALTTAFAANTFRITETVAAGEVVAIAFDLSIAA